MAGFPGSGEWWVTIAKLRGPLLDRFHIAFGSPHRDDRLSRTDVLLKLIELLAFELHPLDEHECDIAIVRLFESWQIIFRFSNDA